MTPHSPSRTPHKHAALIKAWAEGAIIEFKNQYTGTWELTSRNHPSWGLAMNTASNQR